MKKHREKGMKINAQCLNRRKFLGASARGLASLGLMGMISRLPGQILLSSGEQQELEPIVRVLGKTGIKLPVVSLGAMNAGRNDLLIRRALDLGIRHVDTAMNYGLGRNEEMIGTVMNEMKFRDQVVIATKVPLLPETVLRQMDRAQISAYLIRHVDGSLKRLRKESIDLLYLHDVQSAEYMNIPGWMEGLNTAKKQGKARFLGFSTHTNMAECLRAAAAGGFYDVVLTAFNYAMGEDSDLISAMIEAAAAGVGLIAMKTQCKQPWYSSSEEKPERRRHAAGVSHPALLKWVLHHDFITTAVPGPQNFAELEEDFSVASNLDFSEEEKCFLRDPEVKAALKAVCRQCGACVPTCPQGVDVPSLIRAHMYAMSYINPGRALQTLREIPRGRGLERCSSCASCTVRCRFSVPVATRLSDLGRWRVA
jgi:predicted aldo/keto reductase-like oxidoreductase